MWVLDRANSRELLDRLRPHAVDCELEVLWCGEGWRPLVSSCHDELVRVFPDYRFSVIRQKWGALIFRAHLDGGSVTSEEQAAVEAITERFGLASESICEWCGRSGTLCEDVPVLGRFEDLTLCDSCRADMATSPYPSASAPT